MRDDRTIFQFSIFVHFTCKRCQSFPLEIESRKMASYFKMTGLFFNLEFLLIQLVSDIRVTSSSLERECKRMDSYCKMTGLFSLFNVCQFDFSETSESSVFLLKQIIEGWIHIVR